MEKKLKRGGRGKGTPNKVTKDVREAYQMLIEKNLSNLDAWVKKVAEKDPAQALRIIVDLSEYVIPKLARVEANISNTQEDILRSEIRAKFDLLFPE